MRHWERFPCCGCVSLETLHGIFAEKIVEGWNVAWVAKRNLKKGLIYLTFLSVNPIEEMK